MNAFYKLFYYTFIFEDRYTIFLTGFVNTLILSVASFVCGTLFGILFCQMKRSGNKVLKKNLAFRVIVLPHIISTGLELYKNQFILNMQDTAVVGYIALVDLTRASSIVAARTMDSLLGLFTITIIYFVIGFVFKKLFDLMRVRKHIGVETV